MNSSKELIISNFQWKKDKPIEDLPLPIENDKQKCIYEDIENIHNRKKASSLDLDIHFLLRKLI